jgi:UDP-N-acetylmuramyl pentapeptide phosphotransferase/UDP-N-acetylglucosamine-1-phosphate transferase
MTVVLAAIAGAVATLVLLVTASSLIEHPSLRRESHRGRVLPTAGGLVLVAAVIAVDGGRTVGAMLGVGDVATVPARVQMLVAVVAFGFLGLVDDLLGDANDRGLRGHLAAALHGRVTTGFLKLGGGAAVALALAGSVDGSHTGRVIVDAAVVALAANLANLLDRAPGRTLKWSLVAYLPIAVVAGTSPAGIALGVVAGSAAALLLGDLREAFMLGDTGANALGAALGLGAVLTASPGARTAVAVVLLFLTLVSEVVSFSRIIERVPPLRAFDGLGRRAG